ncbi:sulfotransferase family protein [Amaricoccus macauensis]|uniref:sulfotransferase family protein n=1 Tax=Amaricoccus macauensis TaxID=57001 RepID=UPI003C7B742B
MTDTSWLPNFIIAGAPKAGTSSMHAWIADHPDAFGSREKETYFFVDPGTHMYRPDAHVSGGLKAYREQFPIPEGTSPSIILESTPAYLYYDIALAQIPDLPTQPRCLFILREPAAQIYSLYTYFRDNWSWIPGDMDFAAFIAAAREGSHDFNGNELARNAIAYAKYVDYLIPWRERLGADQMMVMTFNEFTADQAAATKRVAEWLGLDPAFYDNYTFPRENETYAPRNRALQKVNVVVRGLLPRGAIYENLRGIYRKLNTRKPTGPVEDEKALINSLRPEFAEANARLAAEFGLDLSGWDVERAGAEPRPAA